MITAAFLGQASTVVLCSVFGSHAETLGHIGASEAIYVEGGLFLREYTARDGSTNIIRPTVHSMPHTFRRDTAGDVG